MVLGTQLCTEPGESAFCGTQVGTHDSVKEAFAAAIKGQGVRGLFRGTVATLGREVPFYVLGVVGYEQLKKLFTVGRQQKTENLGSMWPHVKLLQASEFRDSSGGNVRRARRGPGANVDADHWGRCIIRSDRRRPDNPGRRDENTNYDVARWTTICFWGHGA